MTGMTGCPRLDDAAVYALGALPEGDGQGYTDHLEHCSVCATRVAELTPVASGLALAVPQLKPSPGLRDRLLREVEAEAELLHAAGPSADRPAPARRRSRFSLRAIPAVAWSCVLLALGIGTGVVLSGEDSDSDARVLRATVSAPGAPDAAAHLHLRTSGARLVVAGLPAPEPGRIYQVWLDHPDDSKPPEPTAVLFSVNKQGHASVDVPGDLGDVSDVLVTEEPVGGSELPTRQPIITAQPS